MSLLTNYIHSRTPHNYGNNQQYYVFQGNRAVSEAVDLIGDACLKNRKLTDLFHDVLNQLAQKRRAIAINHGTRNGDDFGLRRDMTPFNGITTTTLTNYIHSRAPHKYGNNQQNYVFQGDRAVSEAVDLIRDGCLKNRKLTDLFHDVLNQLAQKRRAIAINHGTRNGDDFGLRRDMTPFSGITTTTYLTGEYQEYANKLSSILEDRILELFTRTQESSELFKKTEETSLGKASSLELVIIGSTNKNQYYFNHTEEEYKRIAEICSFPIDTAPFTVEHFNPLTHNKEAMRKLKQKSPQDYRKIKTTQAIFSQIQDEIKNSKFSNTKSKNQNSGLNLATRRLEINKKMYATTQYLIKINLDYSPQVPSESSEVNQDSSDDLFKITLIHQDPFLIQDVLDDIAKIFEKAILWNGKDLQELQSNVSLIEYEFAHAMPYARGSAAISEWLERVIYQFHGYNLSFNPDTSVNLEALISPLKDFAQNYPSMIKLEKMGTTTPS